MSLRLRLLLLSLLTLVLPWAGCRYARQMEATLQHSQEDALLTTAHTLAQVVSAEPELLYSAPEIRARFSPADGDLFATLLSSPPLLDGFADEWPEPARPLPGESSGARASPLRLGIFGRALYVYFEHAQTSAHYEDPTAEENSQAHSDRVIILSREAGLERAWSVSASAPGAIDVRPCDTGSPWRITGPALPNINGLWRRTTQGYALELRIPLSLVGERFAVFAVDADSAAAPPPVGWLHAASEPLRERLALYAPAGVRLSVVDARGWLLARAGTLEYVGNDSRGEGGHGFFHGAERRLLGRSEAAPVAYGLPYGMWASPVDEARAGMAKATWFAADSYEPSMVRAAVPILDGPIDGKAVLGAVIAEQAGEHLLALRDTALARLWNLTALALILVVATVLSFAGWLSQRIRRLGLAAATALTPEGRIEVAIPDLHRPDELGDLARSFNALLLRIREYTGYLQTLGSKLSHELRTPLSIVSSSLDNLASESLSDAARTYLERARGGTLRLQSTLSAMSEATRVEQSIEQAERVPFDLAAVIGSAVQAYRAIYPANEIALRLPDGGGGHFEGAPELIVQMLDKLIDNAVSFAAAGTAVVVELESMTESLPARATARAADTSSWVGYRLSVSNEGPPLPTRLERELFESMLSVRPGDDKPHLGLGLYIVRLIALFHGGGVVACNRVAPPGVVVTVTLQGDCKVL